MSENDDTFAGTSARSTKHSAREDDALAHEVEGMIRSGRSTHAEEWNDPEPAAEGEPDVDSSPADTLVDRLPTLVVHLDEDVLPVLATLGDVAPDVHALLDTVQDMRQVVKGFPGSRLFRRRGAEEIAEEEAEAQ